MSKKIVDLGNAVIYNLRVEVIRCFHSHRDSEDLRVFEKRLRASSICFMLMSFSFGRMKE